MQKEIIQCNKCQEKFTIDQNDHIFYNRMKVSIPNNCPNCRQQQRILFRNFKTLYKRPSSKSGKMIISMYNLDVLFPVWDISEWWADNWDATDYAVDLDISIPFIKQVDHLFSKVPHFSLMNTKSENCEYSNFTYGSNNCYLVFGCVGDENCEYGHIVWNSTDCLDNLYVHKSELCYECIDCLGSNKLIYSQECESCVDSIGLYDCRGCTNCIGCVGLRQKSYQIFNQVVSKEDYKEFLNKYPISDESSIIYILNKKEELRKNMPARAVFGSHNDNVTGDHVYNSHNVEQSFDIQGGENSRYGYTSGKLIESYDISFNPDVQYSYQCLASMKSSNLMSCHNVTDSNNVYYSDSCYNSKNIFGCYGLRNKEYCILNKQYTKDEYEKLFFQIIDNLKESGDWGNFFPIWMCPFSYNESIVNEYTPLSKTEALSQGFKWKDNIPHTVGQENCEYKDLPMDPEEYNYEIFLNKILKCELCNNNYKFTSREIAFYKRIRLVVPKKCFNCRHKNRMNARNPRILNDVKCVSCGEMTKTTYSKENHFKYKIYCDSCYKREIN